MNAREKFVYQYYIDKGVPPAAAAAITGNLSVESGGFANDVIAGQRRGDLGSAHYVQQLRGERLTNFRQYAKSKGLEETTLETQLDFVLEEMDPASPFKDNIAAANRDKILNSTDVGEATQAFARYYERPNMNLAHMDRRTAIAQAAPSKPVTRADLTDMPINPPTPAERPTELASLEPEPRGVGLAALLSGNNSVDRGPAKIIPVNEYNPRAGRSQMPSSGVVDEYAEAVARHFGPDYSVGVYSGQEPAGVKPVGSAQNHPAGLAADMDVVGPDGKRITGENPENAMNLRKVLVDMAVKKHPVGFGDGYMKPGRAHIGGPKHLVGWGRNYSHTSLDPAFKEDLIRARETGWNHLWDVPTPAERPADIETPPEVMIAETDVAPSVHPILPTPDTPVSEPEVMIASGPTPPDFFLDKPVHKSVEGPVDPEALLETGPSANPGVLVEPERLLEPVETAAVVPDVSNSVLDTIPRGSPLEVPEIQTAEILNAAPSQPSILQTPTQPEAPQTFAQTFGAQSAPAAPSQPAIAQAPAPPIAVPDVPATPAAMQTAMSQPTGGFDIGGILGGIASALGAAASRPQPGNFAEQKPVEGLLPTPELRHVEPSTPSQLAQNNMPVLSDIDLFDEEERRKRLDTGPQLSSLFRPSRAFG
jgi:hypothetical protein